MKVDHNEIRIGQTKDGIKRFKIWFNGNLEVTFMKRFLQSLKITRHEYFPLLYKRLCECCQDPDFVNDIDMARNKFEKYFLDIMKNNEKYYKLYEMANEWINNSSIYK